jgi:hypothetical protein
MRQPPGSRARTEYVLQVRPFPDPFTRGSDLPSPSDLVPRVPQPARGDQRPVRCRSARRRRRFAPLQCGRPRGQVPGRILPPRSRPGDLHLRRRISRRRRGGQRAGWSARRRSGRSYRPAYHNPAGPGAPLGRIKEGRSMSSAAEEQIPGPSPSRPVPADRRTANPVPKRVTAAACPSPRRPVGLFPGGTRSGQVYQCDASPLRAIGRRLGRPWLRLRRSGSGDPVVAHGVVLPSGR